MIRNHRKKRRKKVKRLFFLAQFSNLLLVAVCVFVGIQRSFLLDNSTNFLCALGLLLYVPTGLWIYKRLNESNPGPDGYAFHGLIAGLLVTMVGTMIPAMLYLACAIAMTVDLSVLSPHHPIMLVLGGIALGVAVLVGLPIAFVPEWMKSNPQPVAD